MISLLGNILRGTADSLTEMPATYQFLVPVQMTAKAAFDRLQEVSPQFRETKDHFIKVSMDSLLAMAVL